MGKTVFVPLHRRPYFVYPFKFGDMTPWYESVKLFRAENDFDWQPVFEKIAKEICALT
jgi:hypothetical protein